MDIDFTSREKIDKIVEQRISELSKEEKTELIKKARKEDIFDLQIDRPDDEMLFIYVKYQLYEENPRVEE